MILLWGSNAREAHPIFFHHMLKAIHAGAQMYAVDPRRTTSAQWADTWLGLNVGSDIALANAMAREIVHAGLHNREFIDRGTEGFEAYAAALEPYTLERGEELSGIPADVIKDVAHTYARAERAQICWTLGITEHHNAVDNVLALINLALLTGHVGRYGSGLNPLRGQNNVQGGGDMGAIPNRLPGFQDLETDPEAVAKFERVWDAKLKPHYGWHMTEMFEAMERGELTTLFVLGENPVQSDADMHHVKKLLGGLEHFVVQDIFLTATAQMADVVLPASASWAESEGTVTNSERRVQRCRKALDAARPGARRHAHPGGPRGAARPRVALRVGRGDLGRAALAGAQPRGHELPAPGGARRHPVAVLLRGQARADVPARPPVGAAPRPGRPRCSTSSRTIRRPTGSRRSSRCASPPAAGWTRSTPACRPAATPRRCAGPRSSSCPAPTPPSSA